MFITTTTGGERKVEHNPTDGQTAIGQQTTHPVPKLLTNAPLCLARTRRGSLCRCPALKGKARCKLHGGRAGAPKGERNGNWKHGGDTREAVALRRAAGRLLKTIGAANDD